MALQMFRKSAGSDRTVDRKVSQSWRTRSSSALDIGDGEDMMVFFMIIVEKLHCMLFGIS